MTYLLPAIPSTPTRTPAKYQIDQLVTFTDGNERQHSGMIIGVEYFAPNTPPAEDWGEGWHYTIHDKSDDSSSTYHIPEADVKGEEKPLPCITLPSDWVSPKYQFQQRVKINHPCEFLNGVFGVVIGLNYHPGEQFWSYEIEVDPNSPMYSFYDGGDTEMMWEERLEALPVTQGVLCHG